MNKDDLEKLVAEDMKLEYYVIRQKCQFGNRDDYKFWNHSFMGDLRKGNFGYGPAGIYTRAEADVLLSQFTEQELQNVVAVCVGFPGNVQ
jgi:hypothetical protein